MNVPSSADHEQDWQPYPVDPYSCDRYIYNKRLMSTLVNVIGTQLRDPINSGLIRWRMAV